MIEIKGFDHVAINVSDIERSRNFFTQVLGLSYAFELHPKHIYLWCGKNMLALVQPEKPQKLSSGAKETIGGVNHLSFRVSDSQFDSMVQQLQRGHVKTEKGPTVRPEEGSKSFYFFDPDGHRLEVTAWTKVPGEGDHAGNRRQS